MLIGLAAVGRPGPAFAQEAKPPVVTAKDLAERPITTATGKVGDLLRKWWKEGTAAGNVGDYYDNRDGGHSDLDMSPYPQLRKIAYSPEDVKLKKHWAAQRVLLPGVVVGNSSTSAPFLAGGSNVRIYYTMPRGLDFLYQQYIRSNLYIYPEHRDHDPGHNGVGDGYGDAFPTNTPYLICSQGSSGSDQPFMRAVPFTLAAFRPDVKKKLIKAGMLMPSVQMILRASSRQVKNPKDYLTGKAHPTVFEGSDVDELKMIRMAHDITLENIPPAIQLQVVAEELPVLGRDYFEPAGASEKLGDTPAVIARIFRGKERSRRMVVSAEKSVDLNKRPLQYHWVLLRGDPKRVRIKPLDDDKSRAEIVVDYQERRPIASGSAMESNRVDIGAFAHNGEFFSAPGFITYFMLDDEGRTYDQAGKVLEIGYGLGETHINVTDWKKALETAASDSSVGGLLPFASTERAWIASELPGFVKLHAALKKAQDRRKTLGKSKKDDPDVRAADKAVAAAQKAIDDFLDRPVGDSKKPLRRLIPEAVEKLARNSSLCQEHAATITELLKKADAAATTAVEAARKRLAHFGAERDDSGNPRTFAKLSGQSELSAYQKCLVEEFNATLLTRLIYPGVFAASFQANYVDPRISVSRTWRDVYRYDAKGELWGWNRFAPDGDTEFTADGYLVQKKDSRDRCLEACNVRYVQEAGKLRTVPGKEIVTYEYAGDSDLRGKIKGREKTE